MSAPTNSAQILRLDPAPSKAFVWIEWRGDAEAVFDERGRTIQPAGPVIRVRYRSTGMEMEAWPVSEEEARRIMQPGAEFNYSSGRAWSQLIAPYKSKRMVKSGERQATVKQREKERRWLA